MYGFFARFAWGHVSLSGDLWLSLFHATIGITLVGGLVWFVRLQPGRVPRLRPALVLLGLAGLAVWFNTFLWPLPYLLGAKLPITAARYTFPAIIPTLLGLAGGWWALWPRAYRGYGSLVFLIGLLALNILAIATIWSFYQAIPLA